MGMFGPKMGSWDFTSEKDPRFNMQGRCLMLVMMGPPKEARDRLAAREAELGVKAPDDLEFGCMKD